MKNIKTITATFIILATFMFVSPQVMSQTPPPPNNGTTGSGGGTPVGGGAPIGGGIMILASLGLAYGYAKFKMSNNIVLGFEDIN